MVIIDHITWLLYYCCFIIMYIAWLDNLRCLFFASIRCACVKSELWTGTLRSLCPYHPRLFFNNYKVTVVMYLSILLTFSHIKKFLPYIVYFCPYPYVTCHTICMSICHRNKRNFKLQNNLRPLARSETGNFLFIYTIPHSYISSFFYLINLILS